MQVQQSLQDILPIACRICHDPSPTLITVCQCSGSLAYVHESCITEWIRLCLPKLKPPYTPTCELCRTAFLADVTALPPTLCYWTLLRRFCQLGCRQMLLTLLYLISFVVAVILGWQTLLLTLKLILQGIPDQGEAFLQLCNSALRTILAKLVYPIYFLRASVRHLQKHRKIWRKSSKPNWRIKLRPLLVRRE